MEYRDFVHTVAGCGVFHHVLAQLPGEFQEMVETTT